MKIRLLYDAEITAEGTEDPKVLTAIAKQLANKIHVGNDDAKDSIFGKCLLKADKEPEVVIPRGPQAKPATPTTPAKKEPAAK